MKTALPPQSNNPPSARNRFKFRPDAALAVLAIAALALLALSPGSARAADGTWDGGSGGSGTAWATTANWVGDLAYPGAIGSSANGDIANVKAGTGTTLQMNMTTFAGNFSLGAMDFERTTAATWNNNVATAGILRLNGATVGGVANTLVRQGTTGGNLTIANGTGTMGLALGNANGIFEVGSGRTLTISSIISQVAIGNGFTKTGAGTLTLSGANTYSGATIISAGTLSLANVNALQNSSGLTLGGASPATLTFPGDTTGVIVPGPITAASSGVNSTISFGRDTATAGTLTLSGGITGGAGNVIFTTPTANGANGGQSQTIELGSPGGYGGNTTITAGGNQFANTIRNGVANALPATTVLTFSGATGTVSGGGRTCTYELNGFNQTLAGLSNGTVPQRRNYVVNSASAATLTINNTADFTFGGANTVSGTISRARIQGAIALTKDGSGTFTLGGTLSGGVTAQGNTFTGDTKILGGILVLGETISIQNSTFDTASSIAGGSANGLRTTVTALTLGGLSGNKNLADVFTTTTGGYGSVTALTLNPGTGATPSYSGAIADGAAGMTLTKTGVGTQTLTGGNDWTGVTIVRAGKLAVTSLPTGTGALTVTNSATLAVTAGGSSWTPASLTVDTCTLEFNNVNTTTAPFAPAAAVATPVTSVTINVNSLAGSPTVGFQYALITNVADATGYSIGLQPPNYAGSLIVIANTLYYQLDAINDNWTGTDAANPTFWNVGISTNWAGNALVNSPAGSYAQNDSAQFDDTATTFTVAIQTNVTPSGVTFNNTTNAYTVIANGTNVIGGTGGVTKLGTNQVTLFGGDHAYSGATIISAGTLQLGDGTGGNDAALTNTPSLLNNGALIYNRGGNGSANYPISGNGTLIKSGAGTLTLLGTNTYIGGTTINGGTLEVGGSGSLNNGNYAAAIANHGALLYSSSAAQTFGSGISGTGAVTKANASVVTFSSASSFSGQFTVENGTASTDSVANNNSGGPFGQSTLPIILGSPGNIGTVRFTTTIGNLNSSKKHTLASGGSGRFEVNNAASTIHLDGLINGGGGLIKSGPGAVNLTANNSYTGNTTVSNGTLQIQVASIAVQSTVAVASPGVLNLGFASTNRIAALVLDGVAQAPGVYKTANSGGRISGAGGLLVNSTPVASAPTFSVAQGETITIAIGSGAKALATDADSDPLTFSSLGSPNGVDYGVAVINPGATSLNYTNTSGSAGDQDVFSFIVSDGFGGLATNSITVLITGATGANLVSATADGTFAYLTYAGIPGTNYALDWATNITYPVDWQQVQVKAAESNGMLRFTNLLSTYPTNDYFRTRYLP